MEHIYYPDTAIIVHIIFLIGYVSAYISYIVSSYTKNVNRKLHFCTKTNKKCTCILSGFLAWKKVGDSIGAADKPAVNTAHWRPENHNTGRH